jgi:hypothetical protein
MKSRTKSVFLLRMAVVVLCGFAGGTACEENSGPQDGEQDSQDGGIAAFEPLTIGAENAERIASTIWLDHAATEPNEVIPEEAFLAFEQFFPLLGYRPNTRDVEITCRQAGNIVLVGTIGDPAMPGQTTGDRVTATYNGCDQSDTLYVDEVRNGILVVEITNAGATGWVASILYEELDVNIGAGLLFHLDGTMEVTTTREDGIETVALSSDRMALDSAFFNEVSENHFVQLRHGGDTPDAPFELKFNGRLMSSRLDGAVTYETTVPFVGQGNNYPLEGGLLITGANNGSVRMVAMADGEHVDLEIDEDGDGNIEAEKTIHTTWEQLEEFEFDYIFMEEGS